MCGIWLYLTSQGSSPEHEKYQEIQHRGPDASKIIALANGKMVFYRLAIQDISDNGMQPFIVKQDHTTYYLMCNGEIYNWKSLVTKYDLQLSSHSDCEVILALYLKLNKDIKKVLEEIRGEFAFILLRVENDVVEGYAARDPYGVRPLFVGYDQSTLQFSSLLKGITTPDAKQMEPGQYYYFKNHQIMMQSYFYSVAKFNINPQDIDREITNRLIQAVKDRLTSDRPIGALLSGGLDSSLVVAIAHKLLKAPLQVFSIGLKGCDSTDVFYAQQVIDHLGIREHAHIVYLDPQEALERIEKVIWECESYDITTIRASIMQYSIAKYIYENTDIKVILNGDGADELQMGYLYFRLAPDEESARSESIKLLNEIHFFDGLRVDRCISACGLEARVPYLDVNLVDYFLNIPDDLKVPSKQRQEKWLIRNAFKNLYPDMLPDSVLFRQKEAFSDGVSSVEDSWYKRLQNYIECKVSDEEYENERTKFTLNTPISKESYYYRKIFHQLFGQKYENITPHFWQPNFTSVKDPSARKLETYSAE